MTTLKERKAQLLKELEALEQEEKQQERHNITLHGRYKKVDEGMDYYAIKANGTLFKQTFTPTSTQQARLAYGNKFATEQAAQTESERFTLNALADEYAVPFVPDSPNYCLVYSQESGLIFVQTHYGVQTANTPYLTKEGIQAIRKAYSDEDLIRLWFS